MNNFGYDVEGKVMNDIKELALIGNEVAIKWQDDREDYLPMDRLRALSPSAETQGEVDILGKKHGGSDQTEYPGVTINGYEQVGSYGIRFLFSDGHNTGIYSYNYLRKIGEFLQSND